MKKRYTKKLIIALVVIALFAITMVCCMAFVMPKNEDISTGAVATSSDSVDSGRYPIYTESNTIIESENFSDSTSFTSLLTKEIVSLSSPMIVTIVLCIIFTLMRM